jgi:hypothetical protein
MIEFVLLMFFALVLLGVSLNKPLTLARVRRNEQGHERNR